MSYNQPINNIKDWFFMNIEDYQENLRNYIEDSLSKEDIKVNIGLNELDTLALDISRVLDNRITDTINKIKGISKTKINSITKELIRKFLLGYPVRLDDDFKNIKLDIDNASYTRAWELLSEGFERNNTVMLDSILSRYKQNFIDLKSCSNEMYIEYIHEFQKDKNQMILLKVNADDNYKLDDILNCIKKNYDLLSNYHYMIIIFEDGDKPYDWLDIAKTAIYMENFNLENNFNLFNRNQSKRIEELNSFIKKNENINFNQDIENIIKNFYSGVAYGFQFEDLFVSEDSRKKVLIMQKVELDEEPKRCPDCFETKVRGNSYTKILYKSFECQNTSCPSRSKIGRGKRYDIFGAKRRAFLQRGNEEDSIDNDLYYKYRRDIFECDEDLIYDLIRLYSWSGDSVILINEKLSEDYYHGRKIINYNLEKTTKSNFFESLYITKLYNIIYENINIKSNYKRYNQNKIGNSYLYNADSLEIIPKLKFEFNGAITSPPYYNAREYSKWPNLISYFSDMMVCARLVLDSLKSDGIYIYNIGDIVSRDNVYVTSTMSNRRQMLGFYSMLIFDIVGYKLVGNIIWDKGEVQSKRNSSANHYPGYIKPINAYEHCIVFAKSKEMNLFRTEVKKIDTVKKINSKGENKLGHSAPYPIEIASLITCFIDKGIVLDPFLGSGTTAIALKEPNYITVGIEKNNEYYELCKRRIKDSYSKFNQISIL